MWIGKSCPCDASRAGLHRACARTRFAEFTRQPIHMTSSMLSILSRSLVAAAVLTITACGGGGGNGGFATPTQTSAANPQTRPAESRLATPDANTALTTRLSGLAAVGAPVANGSVSVQCATGTAVATTTGATGAWSATLTDQKFPCLVTVSGGTVPAGQSLYSMALDASDLNVTPLTGLVVAGGLHAAPSTITASSLASSASSALAQGLAKVNASLKASGYSPLAGNPLTTSFQPSAGDAHDDLISTLMRSLADENIAYDEMLSSIASAGDAEVPIPLTHVFKAAELAAIPQLNRASISASGDELSMTLGAGANAVGSFVGGGNGNKAVLQLPGLAGTKLIDFKDMAMDVKGATTSGGRNVYAYVNFTVDLTCDGSPLAANATLADVRKKRRIVIYDPFAKFVQQDNAISDSAFSTVKFSRATPGWRVSAGTPVGSGVALNPDYIGHETLTGFDFATYPNACIVDGVTGDGGMYRDKSDAQCDTTAALAGDKPAACGKPYSGAIVVLGDSGTVVASDWKVKKIRFNAANVRNFAFQ